MDLSLVTNTISEIGLTGFLSLALVISISAFISGLTGSGFTLSGIFCLWILQPQVAVPLLMALSLTNQIFSLSKLRNDMLPFRQWWSDGPTPFILGGLIGVPIGIHLLLHSNPFALDEFIGGALIIYALWMSLNRNNSHISSKYLPLKLFTGIMGGILGGMIATPGPIVVIWASLAGLSKEGQRGIVQPFILAMQTVALLDLALNGSRFDDQFAILYITLVPFVFASTHLGVWAFKHIQNHHFRMAVLVLLGLSGISLIFKGIAFWGEFLMSYHFKYFM